MTRAHVSALLVLASPIALYAGVMVPRNLVPRTDEPTAPEAFFPTAVGTRWVYQLSYTQGGWPGRWENVEQITESDGRRFVVTKSGDGGLHFTTGEYTFVANGLSRRNIPDPGDEFLETRPEARPFLLLPTVVTPGARWSNEIANDGRFYDYTVVRWEQVYVPAGYYYAVRVNVKSARPGYTGRGSFRHEGTIWYAPEVGIIRFEIHLQGEPRAIVAELKSFSAP